MKDVDSLRSQRPFEEEALEHRVLDLPRDLFPTNLPAQVAEESPERTPYRELTKVVQSPVASQKINPLPAYSTPQRHHRSRSSVFYPAAWDSPYSTPSPHSSVKRTKSSVTVDPDQRTPSYYISERGNRPTDDSVDNEQAKRPAQARKKTDENWLDLRSDQQGAPRVLASNIAGTDDKRAAPEKDRPSTPQGEHQVQEQAQTVNEEDTQLGAIAGNTEQDLATATMIDVEASDSMTERYPVLHFTSEKRPLPPAAEEEIMLRESETPNGGSHRRASSVTSALSSLKSKKRLTWRRKPYIVLVPQKDDRGKRPLLSAADVDARILSWQERGFDVGGFRLGSSDSDGEGKCNAQTCSLPPDPISLGEECSQPCIAVRVPEQAEWDAYVHSLKEEKLRALGVSSNENDRQGCNQSPSTISRAPSQGPGKSLTPPVAPTSAALKTTVPNARPFSPASYSRDPTPAAPFRPQRPQSQPRLLHTEQAVAYAPIHPRGLSPLHVRPSPSLSPFHPHHQQSPYFAQLSNTTPSAFYANVPASGQAFPIVAPHWGIAGAGPASTISDQPGPNRNPPLHLDPRHPYQQHPSQRALSDDASSFSVAHGGQDFAYPAPRGHQYRVSNALQRGIGASESEVRSIAESDAIYVPPIKLNSLDKSVQSTWSFLQPSYSEVHHTALPPEIDLPILQPASADSVGLGTTSHPPRSAHLTNGTVFDDRGFYDQRSDLQWMNRDSSDGHTLAFSASQFKVGAEEVEVSPGRGRSTSHPNYNHNQKHSHNHNALQSSLTGEVSLNGNISSLSSTKPQSKAVSGLNADAPTFTPSMTSKSDFKVRSASFNVEAPVFNPSQLNNGALIADSTVARDKIFSTVVLEVAGKATRRGKLLKVPPTRQLDVEEPTEDDEDGRVQASTARQKRVRVRNDTHDDLVRYDSALPSQTGIIKPTEVALTLDIPPKLAHGNDHDTTATVSQTVPAPGPGNEDEDKPESLPQAGSSDAVEEKEDVATSMADDQKASVHKETAKDRFRESHPSGDQFTVPLSPLRPSTGTIDGLLDSFPAESESHFLAGSRVSPDAPHDSLSLSVAEIRPVPDETLATAFSVLSPTGDAAEAVGGVAGRSGVSGGDVDDVGNKTGRKTNDKGTDQESELSIRDIPDQSGSESDEEGEKVPSYAEIDAVMKQFEDNSDLGVERVDTPLMPPTQEEGLFLNPSINIRSEAPSSSPSYAPSPSPSCAPGSVETIHENRDDTQPSNPQRPSMSSVSRLSSISRMDGTHLDEPGGTLSTAGERRLPSRTQSSDSHVNRVIESIIEDRLGPLEKSLHTIQASISLLARHDHRNQQGSSTSSAEGYSDADDEDEDENATSGGATGPPLRSPLHSKKGRKSEAIKDAVAEALAAYKLGISASSDVEHSGIERLLSEVKAIKDASASTQPTNLKAIVEEVISTHPRLRGKRAQQDHEMGSSDKLQLQIDGLESMLKIANERAEDEYRARREIEDDFAETERRLNLMAEEAAQYREAAEEGEDSLRAYHEEKTSIQSLEQTHLELSLKNAALETTLEEYRLSHDKWHIDLGEERQRNENLEAVLQTFRCEMEQNSQTKQGLRSKIDRLQGDLTTVVEKIAYDQASSAQREQEVLADNKELEAELLREVRLRERLSLDLGEREKETNRLTALVTHGREEGRLREDAAHSLRRNIHEIREGADIEISRMRSTHQHELDLLQDRHSAINANLESQIIPCLQAQVQQMMKDAESMQTRHQNILDDEVERYNRALHQVRESKEDALTEQRRSHEKTLNDLRERHARALHNASDDKHRLEAHLSEKLDLATDKTRHLEGKVADLQDRLEVATTAARAAADFARSGEGVAPPKVAPMATSASMSLAEGSNVPEKISPQALRESLLVLQDQLQHREHIIESLEADLATVDRDAPAKIKHRDTEITWLRELLGVRVDDLEEIVETLSRPEFDREAVKDAIIRLKANLQMEQQERERGVKTGPVRFPSISSLSGLTQSPRALPMAAAAALGNWRRGRNDSTTTPTDHTPSRSSMNPHSFLSGLLTPPRTSQRQSVPTGSAPPTMRALNGRKMYSDARPLRGHSGPVRTMSARQAEKSAVAAPAPNIPSTPPLTGKLSFDTDTDTDLDPDVDADTKQSSILTDVDDDASLVGSEVDGVMDARAGSSLPSSGERVSNITPTAVSEKQKQANYIVKE